MPPPNPIQANQSTAHSSTVLFLARVVQNQKQEMRKSQSQATTKAPMSTYRVKVLLRMLYFLAVAVAVALAFSYLFLLNNTSEVNAVEERVENGVVLQGLGETGMSRLSVAWMPLK
ncbi:MAG: hypothetical protein QNL62_01495, partial [Gammaproteobacteria bacterium]|nr:hypothetical protein [Gammaproteobacteria bacterium]